MGAVARHGTGAPRRHRPRDRTGRRGRRQRAPPAPAQRVGHDHGRPRRSCGGPWPARFDVVTFDAPRHRRDHDPGRAVHHGGLRRRRPRPDGPRRLGHLPGDGHQLRRHGGPGAGRHRARADRAARPAVHLGGRRRRVVVPAARAGPDHRGARHPLHAGVAGRAPGRRGPGRFHGPAGARARRTPRRSAASSPSSRPAATTTCGTGSTASPRPRSSAAGRFDGLAPFGNSEAIASRIAGTELHGYEGGHAFFVQDPAAFPEVVAFLSA